MSTHYNAFISYKHAELDNKIAAMVERGLEHYHIPHKIQKKTGIKRIERIFRDTDELPITSDLSGTIAEALENADYLIVICSTNTCKSMWVEREIKLFLQNHTQDQILTVLADGEPADVVPKILQSREVTRVTEQGVEETVTEPVEPLSCDFRIPKREAKNVELPRLVATLIGSSYNELMDRQRQYKMKRLTAVFAGVLAIALGFAGYMFYSKNQINESYRASLISQSKYLANEAQKLMDQDDRMDALHLAIYALPNEEMPDRPVTDEAVKAITDATMAYIPIASANIAPVWNYEMPNTINTMDVSVEEKLFVALDIKGIIKIWDAKTHEELCCFVPDDSNSVPENFKILSNRKVLIIGAHFIKCINPDDDSIIWEKEYKDIFTSRNVNVRSDGNLLISLSDGTFYIISQADGSEIAEYKLPAEITESVGGSVGIGNVSLSPDNNKIAFTFTNHDLNCSIGIYDITTNKAIQKDTGIQSLYIHSVLLPTDNEFLLVYTTEEITSMNTGYSNMKVFSTDRDIVQCFDTNNLSVKWENDFLYDVFSSDRELIYTPASNAVSYYSGNVCDTYDLVSGEKLHHYAIDCPIIYGYAEKDDPNPSFITSNGGSATIEPTMQNKGDTVVVMKYFADNIRKATPGRGIYVSKSGSSRIIYYASLTSDNEWTAYEKSPEIASLYKAFLDNNVAATVLKNEEETVLDIFDPNTMAYKTRATLPINKDDSGHLSILGSHEGKILVTNSLTGLFSDLTLYSVDCNTGEYTEQKLNDHTFYDVAQPKYDNGKIVFIDRDNSDYFAIVYDVSTGKRDRYHIPLEKSASIKNLFYFEKQGYIYVSGTKDYIIDIDENEIYPLEYHDGWGETQYVSMNEDGTLLASYDKKDIVISDIKGKEVSAIPSLDAGMFKPAFYKDKKSETELLLVPFFDGKLCRYNALTGEIVGQSDYAGYDATRNDCEYTFDSDRSCMYLYMPGNSATSIIDVDSFIELGCVRSSMGYHEPTDTFPCISKDKEYKYHLGYFRHYTLDDLIKKAEDLLQDHEMPQEQKDAYGIG
ncbi:TIR domain-containing protein [Butyrivibrio sp. X503]|uniref:TIR domain-containing protein n=1 Tax=Butyrivibrio sp. X503 TaxID=2364878 RepID=UPI000EA9418E|nr:TIR domain-containing protein [Butyrivibrio sp. X503]RKM55123.1 TIR domain-containing protein [Butyrivibrio sp. X503]